MLVDNKFIYLSLPRRGSTSFHYSCILNGLRVQNINDSWNQFNSTIDFTKINENTIMDFIQHGHEPLIELGKKFGFEYPIIAVKRDRHETFYSLYKHILFDLKRTGDNKIYEHFKNITLDELFFYNTQNLLTKKNRWDIINDYLLENKLIEHRVDISLTSPIFKNQKEYFIKTLKAYIVNIIDILITPSTYWHNNDPNIIWFDIKNLKEMEMWISNITQKQFQLKQVNSSKHMETNLKLDSDFIKKYNSIYDYYDLPKSAKTLI